MKNAELIKVLREVANWIVAMSYNSEYAHDELKMLHYEDSIRAAADALEAAEQRIAELEARFPKGGVWKKILQNGDGTSDYQCSACLGIIMDVPDDDEHPLCSFCPNCGARMKGENDEQADN